jgi:hypothetical protein
MYRGALETEQKKSKGYQVLLDNQIEENSKLQRRLDTAHNWVKKHPNDPKGAQRQEKLNNARGELEEVQQRHQETLKYNGQLHIELDQLKLINMQYKAREQQMAL